MGGHLNLDGGTLNLDGGSLTLDRGRRPPYNLSTVSAPHFNHKYAHFNVFLHVFCFVPWPTKGAEHNAPVYATAATAVIQVTKTS